MNKRLKEEAVLLVLYFTLGMVWRVSVFATYSTLQLLGVPLPDTNLWYVLLSVAWMIKPGFGLFSDKVPLCKGQHRVPYIIINNFLAGLLSLLVLIPHLDLGSFITLLFFISFTGCWADVMYDALMTAMSKTELPKDRGFFQCLCLTVRCVGKGIGGLLGPVLYREGGLAGPFGFQGGVFFLQLIIGGACITEKRQTAKVVELNSAGESVHSSHHPPVGKGRRLFNTLKKGVVLRLLLFNLLSSLLPSGGMGVFFFLKDEMHFTEEQLGGLDLVGQLVRIPVIWLYYFTLRRQNIRVMYAFLVFCSVLVGLGPVLLTSGAYQKLGINPWLFALSDDVLGDALDEARSMPLMTITTIVCDHGMEASMYATSLAVSNLGFVLHGVIDRQVMKQFGVDHFKFENLTGLLVFCALLDFLTLTLLPCLPQGSVVEMAQKRREEELERQERIAQRKLQRQAEARQTFERVVGAELAVI